VGELATELALRATGLFSEVSGALGDKTWGIKNTSDNGIDIITKPKYGTYAAQGGWYGYEVKTSATGRAPELSEHQEKGAESFMRPRIDDLAIGRGRYTASRVNQADAAMARAIQESQGERLYYQGDVIRITNFGKTTVDVEIKNWAPLPSQGQSNNTTGTTQPKPAAKPKARK
jgi:hypothetical protein